MSWTHSELNAIAVKWLLRAQSAKGPSCQVAFQEVSDTTGRERCDAWGWSWSYPQCSVLVEVKVSRSDFLADRKKPHRQEGRGVGTYRYFMCPEGLINIEDLPERWGLLWVNKRGHVKIMAGHVTCCLTDGYRGHEWEGVWAFEADRMTELNMLAYLFRRVGDPDASLQKEREQHRLVNQLTERLQKAQNDGKSDRASLLSAQIELERYREHFGALPATASTSWRWNMFRERVSEHVIGNAGDGSGTNWNMREVETLPAPERSTSKPYSGANYTENIE